MDAYDPVLSSKALGAFLGLSKNKQKELSGILFSLASIPSQQGDYPMRDASGREIQYIFVGDYMIGFWADHAVQEFRIVEIDVI